MKNSPYIILVTGAASSGKSAWAENLAIAQSKPVIYIATSENNKQDSQWQLKIAKHSQRRPKNWQIWEIPTDLDLAIAKCPQNSCVLIDSLGTWVANLLTQNEEDWLLTVAKLLKVIEMTKTDLIFVAEETGWGIVPSYESGRIFRDRLGELIQKISQKSDPVYLITGGYALNLSVLGQKLPTG